MVGRMSLEGFEVFNFNDGTPVLSVRQNSVTFGKSVSRKLGSPEYVIFLFDYSAKKMAVQVCDKNTPNAVKFSKENNSGGNVRFFHKGLLAEIALITGWNLRERSYRVYGTLLRGENTIVFDLAE